MSITQLTTVPADLIGAQALPAPKPVEPVRKPAPTTASQDPDVRLVIQEGTMAGLFIYTIVDRASGQVMLQIPREDLAQLAARPDYEAGQVINTTV
jgi:flagellar protein FlaG